MRRGSRGSAPAGLVDALARVCSTGAMIVLASLILGGIAYMGCLLVIRF
jgi:hypothetical protein